tara:strand:+ start:590 stop:943 length:354 start_codon:yes stop_codon:yes gene_type:complete
MNNLRLPYKRHNICFTLQDTNELIGISRNANIAMFENIFLDGVQNFVLLSTIMLLIRTIPNATTPKIVVKITDTIINMSKKIINFENYYFQIGLTSALLTYVTTIAGVAAIEPKKIT